MPAQYEEFNIDQGADVAIELFLVDAETDEPKNLNSYSARAKMMLSYSSDSADTTNFTTIISDPPDEGIVTLSLTKEQTGALKANAKYVYGVEISFDDSDGNTIRELILDGRITVEPSVF